MDSSGKDWRQAGAPILPISSALKRRQKKKKASLDWKGTILPF